MGYAFAPAHTLRITDSRFATHFLLNTISTLCFFYHCHPYAKILIRRYLFSMLQVSFGGLSHLDSILVVTHC